MKTLPLLTALALCFSSLTLSSVSAAESEKTIVEIAAGDENFSTLVAAVKAAGLAETLSGDGPFTVFAPTNEAFAKLPAGTVETLLKPENKEKLVAILTYHVVAAKVMAADVKEGKVATYALRRGMTFTDREQIKRIAEQSKDSDYPLASLIESLVTSPLFVKR